VPVSCEQGCSMLAFREATIAAKLTDSLR
jgi:hypothetical protein